MTVEEYKTASREIHIADMRFTAVAMLTVVMPEAAARKVVAAHSDEQVFDFVRQASRSTSVGDDDGCGLHYTTS